MLSGMLSDLLSIYRSSDIGALDRLLGRTLSRDENIERTVHDILEDVRGRGIDAALDWTRKLDGAQLNSRTIEVSREEIDEAYGQADPEFIRALKRAADNIRSFHQKQARHSQIDFQPGTALGQMVRPIARAGIYAPGGTAGYPSSVLMNAIPAKVAGVGEIVMVTPPGADGRVSCALSLIAADIAGVDRVFKIGGAQAVGALAYGAGSIPAVDKITGPGNAYVAEAKRQVFGRVGVDSVAGPSEVFIIADESATPEWLAADLLAQAEHDPLAAAVLATTSMKIAEATRAAAYRQFDRRSRKSILERSLSAYGRIIVVDSVEQAVELANEAAPEHLELAISDPFAWLGRIRNAGAVFLGHHTPESVGDYIAGPNHVLPTSGTARFFSPLSVDDFIKKISVVYYSPDALVNCADDIELLALGEGLDAHAHAATVRVRT
ncbi:MAG: histidinol dehydrogenase [Oscillospiraceae bacterium]|nr:histidinol dehydrogenase [Oscillospiraceae bacterium]